MAKHIKTFESIAAFTSFLEEAEGILVANINSNNYRKTLYNKIPSDNDSFVSVYDKELDITLQTSEEEYNRRYIFDKKYVKANYLTFTGDGTVKLQRNGGSSSYLPNLQLEYSTDNGKTWSSYQIGSTIELTTDKILENNNAVRSVMFRGSNQKISYNTSYYHQFIMTGEIYGSGDVTSLNNIIGGDYSLTDYAYYSLFRDCTSLFTAPELPATTLAQYCYQSMFQGCTSLENAPVLPATALASYCYYNMFYGCTALKTAPALPATTLVSYCYYNMFNGCTSLSTAPELPAIALTTYCYYSMFSGCTSLNYIKALFITSPGSTYTTSWLYNVASSGTFVKNRLATWNAIGVSGVPNDWTIEYEYVETEFNPSMAINTDNYVTFKSNKDDSYLGLLKKSSYQTLYISKDLNLWDTITANSLLKLDKDDIYYACGILTNANSSSNYTQFVIDGNISITGNCNSLWNYSDINASIKYYCGCRMFYGCTGLTTAPELPATTLDNFCYSEMFKGCASLTTAPELPATTLATYCYQSMFDGCTSLVTAPELPATTLATYCYNAMFYGCTSLETAPQLSATTLVQACYRNMFNGCTSLTTAPVLPATTLASSCYQYMFQGCTSLITALQLPATTLAQDCYGNMFEGCTSLAIAPQLPATTLVSSCYQYMFHGCTSLVTAPQLPATTLAQACYRNMFQGCTSLTTAPVLPATTLVSNCYNYMFYNCSKLNYVKAMFVSVPSTTYTNNWLYGVASSGTFIKNTEAVWESTGVHAVPITWVIASYLVFTAMQNNSSLSLQKISNNNEFNDADLEYSFNEINWVTYSIGDIISLNSIGNTVAFRGFNQTFSTDRDNYHKFVMSGQISASGSITSLLNEIGGNVTLNEYSFHRLFEGCTSLITAPALPSTNLAESCYERMFYECTSLESSPVLLATILVTNCYKEMFYGCSELEYIKSMNETELSSLYSENWVYGTSSSGTFERSGKNFNYSNNSNNIPENWNVEFIYEYLTFTKVTSASTSIKLTTVGSPTNISLEYSTDGITWQTYTINTNIALNAYVKFRGTNSTFSTGSSNYYKFVITGNSNVNVSGNMASLTNSDKSMQQLTNYCFYGLFKDCTNIQNANMYLPSDILASYCYQNMFAGCTSLATVPALPATTLANYCYDSIFKGCTSLTTVPSLPATTLAQYCYQNMFQDCASLATAPVLPATNLAQYCYQNMFQRCTSLATAPVLPATNLAQYCYRSMFSGCTSLETAPVLPATTLANYCYYSMFSGCTSLETTPVLPATTLAQYCYASMFQSCTSLTTAPELPTTTLSAACYLSMFQNCTSLTIAPELPATKCLSQCYRYMFGGCTSLISMPELPATTLADQCYLGMFDGCTSLTITTQLKCKSMPQYCYFAMFQSCTSLTTAPELPAISLGHRCYEQMFKGCSNLNYIKAMFTTTPSSSYTDQWLQGVSPTGTFVKNSAATWTTTGANAVPTGWTIETAAA